MDAYIIGQIIGYGIFIALGFFAVRAIYRKATGKKTEPKKHNSFRLTR